MDIDATAANQPHDNDATAPPPPRRQHGRRHGRRHLLGAGLGGAAISLLPAFTRRAGATTPPTEPAATTTTAPPAQPTGGDIALLTFAQAVEIAARDLYDVALAGVEFDDVTRTVVATIREAHEAYYQALAGLLGRDGLSAADIELAELADAFAGAATDVLGAMYDLESTAVATHTDVLGALEGTDGAKLIASILIVEARHGTVLADLAGKTSLDDLLVANEADALAPAEG